MQYFHHKTLHKKFTILVPLFCIIWIIRTRFWKNTRTFVLTCLKKDINTLHFNDLHFKDMIIQYLRSFGGATRAELNTLLQSKLSDVLTEEQKIRKIGNMLSALKKQGVIRLTEKKKWGLVEV